MMRSPRWGPTPGIDRRRQRDAPPVEAGIFKTRFRLAETHQRQMGTRRPTIGVTTQTLQAIDGIPAGLPASVVMNQRYYEAVASAGGARLWVAGRSANWTGTSCSTAQRIATHSGEKAASG